MRINQMKSFYQMMKELTKTMKRKNLSGRIPYADEPSYFADFKNSLIKLPFPHSHTPKLPYLYYRSWALSHRSGTSLLLACR